MNINILGRRRRGDDYEEQIDVYEDDAERLYESFNDLYDDFGEGRSKTPFVIIGALLAVAIVGGGLAFAYKRGGADGGDGPVTIRPDMTATKVEPVDAGGIEIPHQDRQVFQQVAGRDPAEREDISASQTANVPPTSEVVVPPTPTPAPTPAPAPAPTVRATTPPPVVTPVTPATPSPAGPTPQPAFGNTPDGPASQTPPAATAASENQGPPTIGALASRVSGGQQLPGTPPPVVTPTGSQSASTPSGAAPALAPRQVRTVEIGPDGSIIQAPAPAAEPSAEAIATAARQLAASPSEQNPEPPTAAPSPSPSSEATIPIFGEAPPPVDPATIVGGPSQQQPSTLALAPNAGGNVTGDSQTSFFAPSPRPKPRPTTPAPVAAAAPAVVSAPSSSGPAVDRGTALMQALAPSTNGRPRPQPAAANRRPSTPAPAASAPAPAPAPAAAVSAASGGGFAVQVASHRRQAEAVAAFADLQQRYPSLMTGMQPLIQRADLGDRGIYYRLRVGPLGSRRDADRLCSSLQNAGLPGCLVREL